MTTSACLVLCASMLDSSARRVENTVKNKVIHVLRRATSTFLDSLRLRSGNRTIDVLENVPFRVSETGFLEGWATIMEACGPPVQSAWAARMTDSRFGHTLASSWSQAQLIDVITFGVFVVSGQAFRSDFAANVRRKQFLTQIWFKVLLE